MKYKSILIIATLSLATIASRIQAQETPPAPTDPTPTSLLKDFSAGALSATNWTVAPYLTYAPKAPTTVGGGVLAIYELNPYLGAAIGVDWLGQLYMPSGNVQLKLPIKVAGFQVTPFALGGIAIPLGGAGSDNRNAAVVAGGGASATVYHFDKGDVALGYAAVNWAGAGDYDGLHHALFVAVHLHF